MRYGDLTYEEIHGRAGTGSLAIVPTGCTEQQGPHLPVDFDTFFVEQICLSASDTAARLFGVQSLVLPALPFGPTPEHRNYGYGYVDIPVELHNALVFATLASLAEQGFQRIVVWRGCGGHDLRDAVNRFNDEYKGKSETFLPGLPYNDIWCRIGDPSVPGGHADSFSTSIALHLRPESVRTDKIVDPGHGEIDWQDPEIDFTTYSSTGVIGNPTQASAALGAQLWEAVVEEAAAKLRSIAENNQTSDAVDSDRLHFLRRSSDEGTEPK
jgi:creatinine amidohydrolase